MFFIDTIETEGLGNRSYLAGGATTAVAVDPPRDIDRVLAAAALRGVRISHVVETHVHNDYVTGGLDLARLTGAAYLVPAGARVSFARIPVADGDTVDIDEGVALRALATPGHTPHHTSYVLLEEGGRAAAVFTGGSLLIGSVGARPGRAEADRGAGARPARLRPPPGRPAPRRDAGAAHARVRQLLFLLPGGGRRHHHRQGAGRQRRPAQGRRLLRRRSAGRSGGRARLLRTHGPGQRRRSRPGGPRRTAPDRRRRHRRSLAAGEWVVDLRNRIAFAEGHVAGSFNFEADGKIATYLAWMIPSGKPVTLLAESPAQLAAAQRELVRVGIDRPAAAATGSPRDWLADGQAPRSFRRATFADLAAQPTGPGTVVLDVRRDSERAGGHITGSVHVPVHELHRRLADVPPGTVWVHCAGGMRAGIAASVLDAAGRDVVAVDDSFDAATAAGLPLTGSR